MRYVVITRDQCNFCDVVKALLEGSGFDYIVYNIQRPDNKWLLTLVKQAGHTTVPQIYAPDSSYIGGYTELKEHLNGGN